MIKNNSNIESENVFFRPHTVSLLFPCAHNFLNFSLPKLFPVACINAAAQAVKINQV